MAQEAEQHLKRIRFTKGLRGYTCEEVDTYLAYVNDRYNTLAKECSELRRKMTVMAAGQNEYREDALRDKEQIAAQAEELYRQKKAEAEELSARSQKKAAVILQEAEKKAADMLRQAELAAEEILSTREAERQTALQEQAAKTLQAAKQEAGDIIARQNRKAQQLVEEMDSFRESVFALYARHLEELEKIAENTDELYRHKEELLAAAMGELGMDISVPDTNEAVSAEDADVSLSAAGDEPVPEPVTNTDTPDTAEDTAEETMDDTADTWHIPEEPAETDQWFHVDALFTSPTSDETEPEDEEVLRIDWKKHRVAEVDETPMADEFVTADDWEDAGLEMLDDQSADQSADQFEDALVQNALVQDALVVNTADDEESWEEAEDNWEDDAVEEEDISPVGTMTEEDLLTALKSEYMTPAKKPVPQTAPKEPVRQNPGTPIQKPAGKDPTDRNGELREAVLDELFYEEGQEVSLTGEFDKIFSAKNSAANVTEISRQPLVPPQKPDKKAAKQADKNKGHTGG